MGRLGAVRQKRNPQTTKLSQLKVELRRVSEKLESREGELAEALEQQPATSEILRVIASPSDIQPMLDAVVESAARLCNATDGLIARVDGDILLPVVAKYGSMPVPGGRGLTRGTPVGRAINLKRLRELGLPIRNEILSWADEVNQVTVARTKSTAQFRREENHA